jgi:hypothetical protein
MSDLLAFADVKPATVQPVYPAYQRPDFNIAPAMDTANKFAMAQSQLAQAKQLSDFSAKANPLRLKGLATEVQNGLDAASQSEKYQSLGRAQAADTAAQYVMGQPEGQRVSAWNAAADTMAAHGIMTPDQAAKWKAVPPDQYGSYAEGLKQTRSIVENYMVSAGGKGGRQATYETASPSERLKVETEADRETEAAVARGVIDKADAPAYKEKLRQQLIDRAYPGSAKPAATPAPAAATPDSGDIGSAVTGALKSGYDWLNKAGTPEATPIFGGNNAGSVAADQGAHEAAMGGKTAADAVPYAGNAKDEAAQKAWFDGIQPGTWFINPADGKPYQKRMPAPTAGGG